MKMFSYQNVHFCFSTIKMIRSPLLILPVGKLHLSLATLVPLTCIYVFKALTVLFVVDKCNSIRRCRRFKPSSVQWMFSDTYVHWQTGTRTVHAEQVKRSVSIRRGRDESEDNLIIFFSTPGNCDQTPIGPIDRLLCYTNKQINNKRKIQRMHSV